MPEETTTTPQPESKPSDANGTAAPAPQKFGFTPEPRKSPFFGGKTIGNVLQNVQKTAEIEKAKSGQAVNPLPPKEGKAKPNGAASQEKVETSTVESKESAPNGTASTDAVKPEGEEEKLPPMKGVDLSRLPGYQPVAGKPDDVDSIKRIILANSGNPDDPVAIKLANQLLHHQRFESSRYNDSELKRLRDEIRELKTQQQQYTTSRSRGKAEEYEAEYDETEGEEAEDEEPKRQPERRQSRQSKTTRTAKDDLISRAEQIAAKIEAEELGVKDGFVELTKLFGETLDESLEEREKKILSKQEQRAKREQEQNMTALQGEVDTHNATVYVDRAKSILAEAAQREGQTALAKRYSDPNYQLNEDEYAAAQERLTEEFEYIQKNFRIPDSGKVSMALFDRASRLLNSQDYEQQIRLDERKKLQAMMSKAVPTGGSLKSDSGIASRSPVASVNQPPKDMTAAEAQRWFLSLPREERNRVLKEGNLAR